MTRNVLAGRPVADRPAERADRAEVARLQGLLWSILQTEPRSGIRMGARINDPNQFGWNVHAIAKQGLPACPACTGTGTVWPEKGRGEFCEACDGYGVDRAVLAAGPHHRSERHGYTSGFLCRTR
jgi:hypothetical protein